MLFLSSVLPLVMAGTPTAAPWPGAYDPKACNANKQASKDDPYPVTIVRCDEMNNPTTECLNLCELCQSQCTEGVEHGYFQFEVLGGMKDAQCDCFILEKRGDFEGSAASLGGSVTATAAAAAVATTLTFAAFT